jgi:hypothetical protein
MSLLRFLFPDRDDATREDAALRRAVQLWSTTGVVPVAHIVAELSAIGEQTREHAIVAAPHAPLRSRQA